MLEAENTAASVLVRPRLDAGWRWLCTAAALGCVGLAAMLVSNYLGPRSVVAVILAAVTAASFAWPRAWLVGLPAVLPILSFAPRTGSFVVEEFDIAVLAAFAGAYARHATLPYEATDRGEGRIGALAWSLIVLLAGSYVIAAWRGATTGMPLTLNLVASDYSPSNNLRMLKGFLWALIALPLLNREVRTLGATAMTLFARGVTLGLLVAALVALWERLAFTGFLDLAADYRITASFWEMHVGGGALDGFLALAVPFALWEALQAPRAWQRAAAGAVAALSGYAVLVTFSRGLYAACAAGIIVVGAGALLIAHRAPTGEGRLPRWVGLTFALVIGGLLTPVFAEGGYRSLAAVCVALAATLVAGTIDRDSIFQSARVAVTSAVVLILMVIAINFAIPKGSYVAFVFAQAVFAIAIAWYWVKEDAGPSGVAIGAYIASLLAAVLVAFYWNGLPAAAFAAAVMLGALAAAAYNAFARRAMWVISLPVVSTVTLITAVAVIVAITASSYAVWVRFTTVGGDFEGRVAHWRRVISLVPAPLGNWFGAGLGQLPAAYLMGGSGQEFPGTFRLVEGQDGPFVRLGFPTSGAGNSEPLRFEQTVAVRPDDGDFAVSLQARAHPGVTVTVALCERHLLYSTSCAARSVDVGSAEGTWKDVRVSLPKAELAGFSADLPRPIVFAISDESPGETVDIRKIALASSDGRSLLRNGDLSAGIAHWFFASDHIHLPWHAKNLWVGVWFDQGWVGASLLLALVVIAVTRLFRAAKHGVAQAIPVLAGILAFLVVGMFDSLLNVPRVAFLAYLTLFVALPRVQPKASGSLGAVTSPAS